MTLIAPNGEHTAMPLLAFSGATNETGDAALNVPAIVGEFAWLFRFAGDAREHHEAKLQLSLRTVPHQTGAAVWDVPTAVATSDRFNVRVGLQCLAGCDLTGAAVRVRNQEDLPIGAAQLGPTTWPGTSGLFWADVSLSAPPDEGVFRHSLALEADTLALPHEVSSASFSIRVTAPPEHTVVVRVVEENTGALLTDVEVWLGPHKVNASRGEVSIPIAAGTYELSIRKEGYQVVPIEVDVQGDLTIAAVATIGLSRAELEAQLSRFDDYPWG